MLYNCKLFLKSTLIVTIGLRINLMRYTNMKFFIKPAWLFVFAITLIYSCRSENEEDYFEAYSNTNGCNTVYVSYSTHISDIFVRKCVDCHTGGAVEGCDLDSYENTMQYIERSQPATLLFDYVKHNDHQGTVLDSCELNQFEKWIYNPAP